MKNLIFVFIACLIISGCKSTSDSFKTVDEISKQENLKPELKSAEIIYNGTKTALSSIDKALPYNQTEFVLVSYGEKSVYITGFNLVVKKKIYLKEKYEALLHERIFDAFINKDTLFIADNSMSIKKVNLITGEMVKIPLTGMTYFSQPYYLSFAPNGNYIYTFNCFANTTKDKIKTGDFVCGAVFTPKGKIIEQLAVPKDVFSHEAILRDRALCVPDGDRFYLCFEMEKNFLLLDSKFGRTDQKSFYINNDWHKPQISGKQLSAYIINTQPFEIYKDRIVHWPPPGNKEMLGRLVVYDKDFNPLKKVYLADLQKTSFYSYIFSGDKLIVYSGGRNGDENIYIYDAKSF